MLARLLCSVMLEVVVPGARRQRRPTPIVWEDPYRTRRADAALWAVTSGLASAMAEHPFADGGWQTATTDTMSVAAAYAAGVATCVVVEVP